MPNKISDYSPGRVLLFSFLFVIGIGTLLLALPQARTVDLSWLDLLFTAVSTTCVTGLRVIPMSSFTTFGKAVILCLMQIGGLGLMTLSFFFISLFLNLGMATQLIAGEILEFKWWSRIKSFLMVIVSITVGAELIGACFLYFPFRQTMDTYPAIFYAFFHSVSAFCNAGISLFDNGITSFTVHPFPLLVLASLVFMGGVGFIVWIELFNKLAAFLKRLAGAKKHIAFSLHTKLVLLTSILLIFVGTVGTWLLEYRHTFKDMSFFQGLFASFFNAVSIRNAGFEFLNLQNTTLATLLIFLFLMYIGASPSSTGSGIKTTTFAVFFATMSSIIRGREDVEIFGRSIPTDQVYKAISIIALSGTWIVTLTFVLLLTEPNVAFLKLFFEAISAFSNCGLSTGITPTLSISGKSLVMITMIVGRIGSLTLVLALRKKKKKYLYTYPEERVAIG